MHGLGITVGILVGSMWDISQNHGGWTRAIAGTFVHFFRAVGIL